MLPVLLDTRIAGVHVLLYAYGTMLALAAVATIAIGWCIAGRRGASAGRSLGFLMVTALAVPVGARILDVALNPSVYAVDPGALYTLEPTGFGLYGGLLLAAGVGIIASRLLRLDLWRVADATAPALGVGIAMARVGCLLNGCCYGVIARGPLAWLGVTFPPGSPAWAWQVASGRIGMFDAALPVVPTQIFELVGALAGAGLAAGILVRGRTRDGTAFLVFVAWFSAARWATWLVRVPTSTFVAPGWAYPALYAVVITACVMLTRRRAVAPDASSRVTLFDSDGLATRTSDT